jgi:hypothetical protein
LGADEFGGLGKTRISARRLMEAGAVFHDLMFPSFTNFINVCFGNFFPLSSETPRFDR